MPSPSNSPLAFSVNHWGSHPDSDNDDCFTGEDFESKEEALAFYNKDASYYTQYIEIDGPGINEIRKNPAYNKKQCDREDAADRRAERSEYAMQAGMAFGCDGYNDAMGY